MFLWLFILTLGHAKGKARPHLSVEAMEAIAKQSIVLATNTLNEELAGTHEGMYSKNQLEALRKMGKKSVSPEYLFDKCIYTKDNILSLLNSQFTMGDDAMANKNKKLYGMRGLYKHKIWKLIGRACVDAKNIFEARLKTLTVKNEPLGLDKESIRELSLVMFFPTHLGGPSFKRKTQHSFSFILSTAVVIGTVGVFIGLPMTAVILTITVPVNSLWNYSNNIAGNINYTAQLPEMITTGHYLFLDLTPEEHAWIKN